jgi:hypothetical protein
MFFDFELIFFFKKHIPKFLFKGKIRILEVKKAEYAMRRNELTHKGRHAEELFYEKQQACSIFPYQYPDLYNKN